MSSSFILSSTSRDVRLVIGGDIHVDDSATPENSHPDFLKTSAPIAPLRRPPASFQVFALDCGVSKAVLGESLRASQRRT